MAKASARHQSRRVTRDGSSLDEQIDAGRRVAAIERAVGLRAKSARYDEEARRVVVELITGYAMEIPISDLPDVASAPVSELSQVEVIAAGNILHWESLDADYSIVALLARAFPAAELARQFAARGGRATSTAKSRAARANGKKGGRPRLKARRPT